MATLHIPGGEYEVTLSVLIALLFYVVYATSYRVLNCAMVLSVLREVILVPAVEETPGGMWS